MILHMAPTAIRKRAATPHALATLPDENDDWGWRMKRARERYAGLSQGDAMDRISALTVVDRSAIARIEASPTPPTTRSRRLTAYLLVVIAYKLDPEQFGLSDDDVPPGIREQVSSSTKWNTRRPVYATFDRVADAA